MDPWLILFGFGVGILVGTTGMGGGSLMTPLLILVFGIKPVVAVGSDLAYAAVTKTAGGFLHFRKGMVQSNLAFWLAIGSCPGAVSHGCARRATRSTLRRAWCRRLRAAAAVGPAVSGRSLRAGSPAATTRRARPPASGVDRGRWVSGAGGSLRRCVVVCAARGLDRLWL